MPEEKIEATGIPLFRLTLIGAHGVGKTCLVNSIMNNVPPPAYKATRIPELYYFLLRLSYDEPIVKDTYDDINAFCFEIEDTCADDDVRQLIDMSRAKWPFESGMNDYTPFGIFKEPLVPMRKGDEFRPVSQNRMAFLVVFDVSNYESYKYAVSIVEYIMHNLGSIGTTQPLVCLVANKSDLMRDDAPIWEEAETFSQARTVPIYRVSTILNKNIAKMMRELAMLLYGSLALWEIVTHTT
ncbi:Ras family protein [Babesia ovata]|uniref:Ras family protein n=1 Tax=Babesia ovata TaxID=189622 RepID=A0A2H6KCF9_9APIC|nr:Ras family protein [Babesia ovata]GBE60672.1 Ras family protein [Babesia ovata]